MIANTALQWQTWKTEIKVFLLCVLSSTYNNFLCCDVATVYAFRAVKFPPERVSKCVGKIPIRKRRAQGQQAAASGVFFSIQLPMFPAVHMGMGQSAHNVGLQ